MRLGAIRQQAITWTNVDPDLYRHMTWIGHNELMTWHIQLPKWVKQSLDQVDFGKVFLSLFKIFFIEKLTTWSSIYIAKEQIKVRFHEGMTFNVDLWIITIEFCLYLTSMTRQECKLNISCSCVGTEWLQIQLTFYYNEHLLPLCR